MEIDETYTEIFTGCIPQFAVTALEALYGNVFSSLEHFGISGHLAGDVHTYVAWKADQPITVLLFRLDGHTVRVLNEVVYLPAQELRRFSDQVFGKMPAATIVLFHAIRTDQGAFSLPYQRFNYSEDIIVPLPQSRDEYVKSIGKATRKNIKHHLSRLKRTFPSFQYTVYLGEQADERIIRKIVQFNRMRFGVPDKERGNADLELERLIELVKKRGMVGVATIDGDVCGGAICTHASSNYFSHVTSHDPRYDSFRLGTICCFLTICQCIDRGGKEFHLLWGKYDYKYRLGGIEHDLEDVLIYRSWMHYLRHADIVLAAACRGNVRKMKVWLQRRSAQQESLVLRFIQSAFAFLRNRKRPVP